MEGIFSRLGTIEMIEILGDWVYDWNKNLKDKSWTHNKYSISIIVQREWILISNT